MPLDGHIRDWDWDPKPQRSIFDNCYVVIPQPGPRGGLSRPRRWTVERFFLNEWVPTVSFVQDRGYRQARITGGFLIRDFEAH